jgi:ribonuclease E
MASSELPVDPAILRDGEAGRPEADGQDGGPRRRRDRRRRGERGDADRPVTAAEPSLAPQAIEAVEDSAPARAAAGTAPVDATANRATPDEAPAVVAPAALPELPKVPVAETIQPAPAAVEPHREPVPVASAVPPAPVAPVLPADSGLELVETRFAAAPVVDDAPPAPRRVRPPRVVVDDEPLQFVETRTGQSPPA